MIKIINSGKVPEHLETYIRWITEEWGEIKSPDNTDVFIPEPILAFEGPRLAGGLSFINYKNPSREKEAVWINTLFIEPSRRRSGIGSLLIDRAEEIAQEKGIPELFVFTEIPELYRKNGWKILRQDGPDFILVKSL